MQVLKLCKLAYKPRPHYCFEMIFSKCHILYREISEQLKTAQLSFYMQMMYFIILDHFHQIKYQIMLIKMTEHHLQFLSLKGGCTGSSESTHVKMPHCWKSHALTH